MTEEEQREQREAADEVRLKDGAPELAAQLHETWRDPPGLWGWFCPINHKTLAKRFILTTLVFFAMAGHLGGMLRQQLSRPENDYLGPDAYNQVFTMHGSTMMFLFAVPVMQAFAIYLIPQMIGARTVAFPRMNAFAWWLFTFGGVMLYAAFFVGGGPDAGWFSYVPLAGPDYGAGKRSDFWAQMITFTEVSGLLEAIVIITTVFKLRAPGLTLNRVPLFCWAMVVTSFMILFAMPAIMLSSTALILDRLVATHFFNPGEGGDVLLWQHLFWFFGHPEVYFIFLPGLAIMSAIIPTFARRPMFGYSAMVLSLIATGFLSFGLWVHHMFLTNIPELGKSFFTAASMLIAIPTAVQIFCWIATLATGRLNFKTPLYFVLAFFFILILGGMTGIMLASVPLDVQVHDTYFVVAHLHYVLIGGAVFPLFGGFYYWYPKFTGRMMSEFWGRVSFWVMFVGMNGTFFPMHLLGMEGMPRRVWTYQDGMGWHGLNEFSSMAVHVFALGLIITILNAVFSIRRGVPAGPNPWGAGTLEWATDSPPLAHNFTRIPVVYGRDPLWEPGPADAPTHVSGLAVRVREQLVTTLVDAHPDHRLVFPNPTPWPFLSAVATTIFFIGSIFTPWAVIWGTIPIAIGLTFWFWPKKKEVWTDLALEKRP